MINKLKKICVVTGTRAEYGLLSLLLKSIQDDMSLDLCIIVTGSHLSPEFGLTYKEIEKDGFRIDKKIEMVISADTSSSIAKSTGLGMIGFADALYDLKPDLMVLLGDRYEILAASFAAVTARIPIAHISGGETTEGAFDECIRHSITKMSWWHFAATDQYKKRIIQLGEHPGRVYNVGGLGVDLIKNLRLLSKKELSSKLGINFLSKNLLITYHPVTLEKNSSIESMENLLEVLADLIDVNLIFTMPNADSDGRSIFSLIQSFVLNNSERAIVFKSMGHLNYLSVMQFVDGVIGNSSSGIAEAPSLKVGTVNIGDRQKGRLKAASVIDCEPNKLSIKNAINILFSKQFRVDLKSVSSPFGNGNATRKIFEVLKNNKLPEEIKKEFYNL